MQSMDMGWFDGLETGTDLWDNNLFGSLPSI